MDEKSKSPETHIVENQKLSRSSRKLFVIGAACLVVILIVAITTFVTTRRINGVFVVNGKTYTAQDIKPMTSYLTKYTGVNINDATKKVYEMEQYKAAADAIGVKPTRQEMTTELNNTIYNSSLSPYKSWFDLIAFHNAVYVPSAPDSLTTGIYQGYAFEIPFFNSIDATPAYVPPNFGDAAALASDQQYAKQKAQEYYNSLKSGSMSYDQVLQAIQSDARLGYQYVANTNQSAKFGYGSQNWKLDLTDPVVKSYISKQTQTGLHTIQTAKIPVLSPIDHKSSMQDGFYFFVYLKTAQQARSDLDAALNSSLQKIKSNSKYNL